MRSSSKNENMKKLQIKKKGQEKEWKREGKKGTFSKKKKYTRAKHTKKMQNLQNSKMLFAGAGG